MNELSAEYLKAKELDRRIKTSAQLTQQSLYDMCMGFKEMRDSKLYKELGYSDFGEYCEQETGFTRRNVYNYIAILEKLPAEFVKSISQIGITKLTLLTKIPDDQRTEITETTDLESTSVRELKEKISDLKKANERLMQKNSDAEESVRKSQEKESEAWGKVSILKTDTEMQKQKISQLESEIKAKNESISALEEQVEELENRPVEVAVAESDSHEIENLKDAMKRVDLDWSQKYNELQEENIKETIASNQKHAAELEQLKAEYEKKLAEAEKVKGETVPDTKEVFRAYLSNAVDAVNRLLDFVGKYPDEELFRSRIHDFFGIVTQRLEAGQNEQ